VHNWGESVHENALLNIPQAAKYIGMSTRWLYRRYRILPHIRIGFGKRPRIRFKRVDLDRWVSEHSISPVRNQ